MKRPAFPTVADAKGIRHDPAPKVHRIRGLVRATSTGISIVSREQGMADMHRRDAIKRGGI